MTAVPAAVHGRFSKQTLTSGGEVRQPGNLRFARGMGRLRNYGITQQPPSVWRAQCFVFPL
jgi:hypothetical protein